MPNEWGHPIVDRAVTYSDYKGGPQIYQAVNPQLVKKQPAPVAEKPRNYTG